MFFRAITPLLPLIPIGLVVVAVAISALGTFRRRRGRPARDAFVSAALDVLLGASILSVLLLTLLPSIDAGRSTELIPFHRGFRRSATNAEMAANMVLFVPLGAFAPARWPVLDGWGRVLLGALAFSGTIEILQFVLALGRQASTTDVILNVAGAALGYLGLLAVRGAVGVDGRRGRSSASRPGRT